MISSKVIRVLHVFGKMNLGGAESRTMDIYRNIDRSKVQFDFLVHTNEKCYFDDEIRELGGRIFSILRLNLRNIPDYIKTLSAFFKAHKEYNILHGHAINSGFIYFLMAKMHGVPYRISHARSAKFGKGIDGFIKQMMVIPLRYFVTHQFAVSLLAGQSRYGLRNIRMGKVQVIPNAIETDKFTYNVAIRGKVRRAFGIDNSFVVGHVGRLHFAKNHEYLIDIFFEIFKQNKNSVLLLIGTGELENKIKQKVKNYGLKDSVKFLGKRSDIAELLQAMDVFVFPSHYEGMPGTVIEAQASGLRCFVSDKVTDEVRITPLVEFLPIDCSPKVWADRIIDVADRYERRTWSSELSKEGFDAKIQAKKMEEFYLNLLGR